MNPIPFDMLDDATWIWPGALFFDIHNAYALFRKEVVLAAAPKAAPTLITADQSYRLYVNGRYVCRGPARGYQHHWPYDEVDLAPFLHIGRNVIAVQVHNPGFSTFQYLFQGWAGLLFMGRWGETNVISDRTWKSCRQKGIARDTIPSTLQLFCQEHVDLRVEPEEWMAPDFDDAGWEAPQASYAWNSPPWESLEPRGIPLLRERRIGPVRLLGRAAGTCADGFEATRNVVDVCRKEVLEHEAAQGNEGDGAKIVFPPGGEDGFASVLLDFGRTVVGNLRLRIAGARGGEIVDAAVAETVSPSGLAPRLDQLQVSLGSRLVCRAGEQAHTFYHPYGFRYLLLRTRRSEAPLTIEPSLDLIGYPFEIEGRFVSSDTELNRIWEACAWTQQVCSLDAYVDTPWREQAQWWGDARVQAWNTFHLCADARLLRRGIASIAGQTTRDGLTYGHAPTMAHHCVLPDFTLIWLLSLWDHYWQTGSAEAFLAHRDTVERALDYFRIHSDPGTGLVAFDRRHWLFLDWADMFKDGYPSLLSLWLLLAVERIADLCRITGDDDRARELGAWAARLRGALHALTGPDGLVGDGRQWDGRPVAACSIHAQVLALLARLDPARDKARREASLLPFVRGTQAPRVKPSVYWLTYLYTALDEAGYGADVVAHIRSHWKKMADHGTTWSQLGEYGGEHSHSHAWSAHPLYHLVQIVGGVRQRAPAWRRIEFRPLFWGAEAEVAVPTPSGLILSSWEKTRQGYRVALTLPDGIRAAAILPGRPQEEVTGSRTWEVADDLAAAFENPA